MRPDAEQVWKNDEIRSRFNRYFSIIKKEKIARYLITKKIPITIELDESIPIEKLWSEHQRARGKFNKFLQELDAQQDPQKYYQKSDTPKVSFLDLKIEIANRILQNCHFCERECNINRENEKGTCRLGKDAYVSSWFHHMGEEAPLIPSGTKN